MITFILLSPILFMGFLFYLFFTRQSVKYDMQSGKCCWNCKEATVPLKFDFLLCESCQRDLKIVKVYSFWSYMAYKFKRMIVTTNFRKLLYIILLLNVIFMLLLGFFAVNKFPFREEFSLAFTLLISIFWILLIIENKLTTIKKPSKD